MNPTKLGNKDNKHTTLSTAIKAH